MSDIDEEVLEERIYTVPLGKMIYTRGIPRRKRTPRAVRLVRPVRLVSYYYIYFQIVNKNNIKSISTWGRIIFVIKINIIILFVTNRINFDGLSI